jgi:hypothetical protein
MTEHLAYNEQPIERPNEDRFVELRARLGADRRLPGYGAALSSSG